jgi:hypothetical protein
MLVLGSCGKNAVKNTEQFADGEVRSMVGQWRANISLERGTWTFEANGACTIKSDGLREQKGTYTYTGKELTLNLENGSITYKIIENNEPALKLFTRWQDSYDITIPLIRIH